MAGGCHARGRWRPERETQARREEKREKTQNPFTNTMSKQSSKTQSGSETIRHWHSLSKTYW